MFELNTNTINTEKLQLHARVIRCFLHVLLLVANELMFNFKNISKGQRIGFKPMDKFVIVFNIILPFTTEILSATRQQLKF